MTGTRAWDAFGGLFCWEVRQSERESDRKAFVGCFQWIVLLRNASVEAEK